MVFIVDDDAEIRALLADLCDSVGLPVRSFASPQQFRDAERPDVPSCLILDVRFPGVQASGLDFYSELAAGGGAPPVIFISGYSDVRTSVQAMKHGAVEFLVKPLREQDLLDAVRRALELDRQRRQDHALLGSLQQRFGSLSPREREIMDLVSRGHLNKQIALQLNLSEVTVKSHRAQVMEKMQATSLPHLVRMSDQLTACSAGHVKT
jgi:FixJ family two-component response regulator